MLPQKKLLEDRGVLPTEKGNRLWEYQAMHEENISRQLAREELEETTAEMKEWKKEAEADVSKSGT